MKRVGEGSFGEVRKGIDKTTGAVVALKYIRSMGAKGATTISFHIPCHPTNTLSTGIPRAAFRELTLLRQFEHPRVLSIILDLTELA